MGTPDDPDDDHPAGVAVWILPILAILVVLGFLFFTIYGR